jgi:hypothetical protein
VAGGRTDEGVDAVLELLFDGHPAPPVGGGPAGEPADVNGWLA